MPSAKQTRNAGLAVSLFVAVAAAGLALRQRSERLKRSAELDDADSRHFRTQDRRRAWGAVLMILLALGVSVGSRVPHLAGGRSNPAFLFTWLAVFLLVLVLLALAFIDLWATRIYGRRQHHALVRERLASLRKVTLRQRLGGSGWNQSLPPGNGFPH
ncbi:MAG: hypothetical protein P4L84_25525 [Isosphaeraceae bacterium]|nr:hypothetical protein [Isosphaeraceae bacterium]